MHKRGLINEEIEELMRKSSDEEEVVSQIDDHASQNELSFADEDNEESHKASSLTSGLRFTNSVKSSRNQSHQPHVIGVSLKMLWK